MLAAVAVYSGTLAVTAVFFTLLWLYAAGNHRLVDRELDPLLLRAMTRRYVLGMSSTSWPSRSPSSARRRAWP